MTKNCGQANGKAGSPAGSPHPRDRNPLFDADPHRVEPCDKPAARVPDPVLDPDRRDVPRALEETAEPDLADPLLRLLEVAGEGTRLQEVGVRDAGAEQASRHEARRVLGVE